LVSPKQLIAPVTIKGSVIEDAQYAVNLGQNAEMRSVVNYFQNNYISINANFKNCINQTVLQLTLVDSNLVCIFTVLQMIQM